MIGDITRQLPFPSPLVGFPARTSMYHPGCIQHRDPEHVDMNGQTVKCSKIHSHILTNWLNINFYEWLKEKGRCLLPSGGRTDDLTPEYVSASGTVMLSMAWWASSASLPELGKLVTSTISWIIFMLLSNLRTWFSPCLHTGIHERQGLLIVLLHSSAAVSWFHVIGIERPSPLRCVHGNCVRV